MTSRSRQSSQMIKTSSVTVKKHARLCLFRRPRHPAASGAKKTSCPCVALQQQHNVCALLWRARKAVRFNWLNWRTAASKQSIDNFNERDRMAGLQNVNLLLLWKTSSLRGKWCELGARELRQRSHVNHFAFEIMRLAENKGPIPVGGLFRKVKRWPGCRTRVHLMSPCGRRNPVASFNSDSSFTWFDLHLHVLEHYNLTNKFFLGTWPTNMVFDLRKGL